MKNIEISRPTISLAMIVKDEEANLAKCLDSAKQDADEIIITDTGSTDNSKEIAQAMGALIYDFKWVDDFSAARNFAVSKATGDWILHLDADETIKKSSQGRIKEVLSSAKTEVNALNVEVKNVEIDSIFSSLRLFRNNGTVNYSRRVHENLTSTIEGKPMIVDSTGIQICHFGYSRDPQIMLAKSLRNLKILKKELAKFPDNAFSLYYLAMTMHDLHRTDEALLLCEKILARELDAASLSSMVMAFYVEVLFFKKDLNKIVESVRKYNSLMNYNPEIAYYYGMASFALSQYDEAYEAFNFCLENEREGLKYGNLMPANFGNKIKEARMMLDLKTDNHSRAREAALDILKVAPGNSSAQGVLDTLSRLKTPNG